MNRPFVAGLPAGVSTLSEADLPEVDGAIGRHGRAIGEFGVGSGRV
jgi:hypothetical protein